MSETVFTVVVWTIWLSEVVFGAVVVYWFVTQGLSDDSQAAVTGVAPLEDRSYTLQSLGMWAAFFVVLLVGIIVAS
ncbi:MAG: hypothetical protein ABEH83_06550 [Halobacterium sp.]